MDEKTIVEFFEYLLNNLTRLIDIFKFYTECHEKYFINLFVDSQI